MNDRQLQAAVEARDDRALASLHTEAARDQRIAEAADAIASSIVRNRAELRRLFVTSGELPPCEVVLPMGRYGNGGPLDELLFNALADAADGCRDGSLALADIADRLTDYLAKRPDVLKRATAEVDAQDVVAEIGYPSHAELMRNSIDRSR